MRLDAFLGAYQASKDVRAGIEMDIAERAEQIEWRVFEAAIDVAEKKVKEYHDACASHYLWESEVVERGASAADVQKEGEAHQEILLLTSNAKKGGGIKTDVGEDVRRQLLEQGEQAAVLDEAKDEQVWRPTVGGRSSMKMLLSELKKQTCHWMPLV